MHLQQVFIGEPHKYILNKKIITNITFIFSVVLSMLSIGNAEYIADKKSNVDFLYKCGTYLIKGSKYIKKAGLLLQMTSESMRGIAPFNAKMYINQWLEVDDEVPRKPSYLKYFNLF